MRFVYGLIDGLSFLNSIGLVHRSLSPSCVLFDEKVISVYGRSLSSIYIDLDAVHEITLGMKLLRELWDFEEFWLIFEFYRRERRE